MSSRHRTILGAFLLAGGLVLLPACGGNGDDDIDDPAQTTREFQVTVENLTDTQPFSPGIILTHDRRLSWWTIGEPASEGLRLIAENGDPSLAVDELDGRVGVGEIFPTSAPVHRQGGAGASTLTFNVTAPPGVTRISIAMMLICTNDGFVGIDSIELPQSFQPLVGTASALDAGTEVNDELFESIVDACNDLGAGSTAPDGSNDRTAEDGLIDAHPGIQGTGDLDPGTHGWAEPVAEITIQRIS